MITTTLRNDPKVTAFGELRVASPGHGSRFNRRALVRVDDVGQFAALVCEREQNGAPASVGIAPA